MLKISQKQQNILEIVLKNGLAHSSTVREEILKRGDATSLVTVKRALSEMVNLGLLVVTGSGRSTGYSISNLARVFYNIDPNKYFEIEPDKRYGSNHYNFEYFSQFPQEIFSTDELDRLEQATANYKKNSLGLSKVLAEKELLRLIIELSWKSSKIEGNTYTLIDTEKLIVERQEAAGHTKKEATMILNHKDAFNFIRENSVQFTTLTLANLEKLHSILIKDLEVETGIRSRSVGITGSKYQPLDNKFQIKEAIEALSSVISRVKTPYCQALLALTGIGYIQPFEDGNKRTSRLMANALLLAHGHAPLSYRSIDEGDYREAMLAFYELNTVVPFKKIFIDQYEFAAKNYSVKAEL